MKRFLLVMLLVLSLVICLPSCVNDKPQQTPSIEENPDFATYNAMFDKDFSSYVISMSITSINDDVINETYRVNTVDGVRSVEYRIERLNQFVIDGELITAPDGYISVTEGVYDATESSAARFDVPDFNFSYACLGESEITVLNSYSNDILSLEQFMGLDVTATDASLNLSFQNNEVKSISISYVSAEESTVVITYTFN